MAQIHAPVPPASASSATHCSLRRTDRVTALHPLKQNPPSVLSLGQSVDWSNFDDVEIDAPLRPPPSALTATSTHYDPHDPDPPLQDHTPRPAQGHQRSLTGTFLNNCQPFLSRATSTLQQHTARASLHSPTKSLASFIPSRSSIGATASQPKIKAGAKALQNWFNGTSGPVNLGVTAPDDSEDDCASDSEAENEECEGNMLSNIFNRGSSLTSPSPGSADTTPKRTTPHAQPSSTTSTRFTWPFSTSNQNSKTAPTYHNPSDDLLNLNISQSLFPHGPVDPLAPSSFNDLLSTAEALLTRYQSSYRQLSTALRDARAEQSAQEDELEEADTRVDLLKMQLKGMAQKAEERDEEIRRLREELEWERRMRKEAENKRSITLVRGEANGEEQQQQQRRRNRASNSGVSVDSGFFDEDGDGESVRSACCVSPTAEMAAASEATPIAKMQRPQLNEHTPRTSTTSASLCANCANASHASVWARLAREREESQLLRRRIETLESAVEGALDVVDGPWGLR